MTNERLQQILDSHKWWLNGEEGGARADLTDADLTRADLTRANLTDADLTRANLTDAYLTRANLTDANLTRANLTDANLTRADLTDAYLTDANLTRANLTRANLTDADLTRANLTDADLTRANLTRAKGFRFDDAPDPITLRHLIADHIEAHPELHNQENWGDGSADPTCGTPCCVAGWACHLGGGNRDQSVSSAATRLLWVDGLPMPSFDTGASREEIIGALRANLTDGDGGAS